MPSRLTSACRGDVLERLHARADDEDELASQRVRAREAEIGERLLQARRSELYGQAPLAITRGSDNCSISSR